MKATGHPVFYQASVSCVCGNSFTTGSTLEKIRVEICANCHPLYTGTQKLVDTQGQVEKFIKSKETSSIKQAQRVKIEENRAIKTQSRKSIENKTSLKDLLLQARKS